MAWSRIEAAEARGDDGFATAAATMISLALAVVATVVTASAIANLRLARSDFAKDRAVYALAGAHEEAALTMLAAGQADRLDWTETADGRSAGVRAEAEDTKLSIASAATLDAAVLAKLGVADPDQLRQRLLALKAGGDLGQALVMADTSPIWRTCVRSFVSPFGEGKTTRAPGPVTSVIGPAAWRPGAVWRIRIALGGWVDDRIVRVQPDNLNPEATLERSFHRVRSGDDRCAALFAS